MHVGLVSLTDIEYGLDLANALSETGVSVSLYMSRSHTARVVGDSVRPAERVFELRASGAHNRPAPIRCAAHA